MKLTVNLGKDSYPIYIENNILSQAGNYIRKMYHGKRIMIIRTIMYSSIRRYTDPYTGFRL